MKNVILTAENGDFKLLNSVDDGTNALIIDEVTIPTAEWIGEGAYTYTDGSFTYNIVKASRPTGNWQLIQDDPYNYHFERIKTKTDELLDVVMDRMRPIGSHYITFDVDFNPNTEWIGTWILEDEGLVLLSAGSNYQIGSTGGEATHKLTGDESGLPKHGHGFTNPTYKTSGSDGGHSHTVKANWDSKGAAGSATRFVNSGTNTTNLQPGIDANTGTHGHTISLNSGGSVAENNGFGAIKSHNNMQPYKAVNVWKRVG